jgi:hypothetical protein
MDLAELDPKSVMQTEPMPLADSAPVDDAAHELVSQMAAEIATPLTAALERVTALATTGTIDRRGLAALREELEAARRASIVGQQIGRLASGRIRQTHERLNLTQMLRDALVQRGRETQARGIQMQQVLKPAEVIVDASLLFGLIQAVLDWALEHARTQVDFRLDMKSWPAHARMSCRFGHRPPDQTADRAEDSPSERASSLDTLSWRLVDSTARAMNLIVQRDDNATDTTLVIEFPRTVNDTLEGASAVELDHGFALSGNSRPLAGSHVLVVAARRDVRTQVRHAIAHMGLIVDFVSSLDGAREFCSSGLPHAIVYESALGGDTFESFKHDLDSQGADLVYIEITEQGQTFEVSSFGGAAVARVGRDAIVTSLPSALMFELSKGL